MHVEVDLLLISSEVPKSAAEEPVEEGLAKVTKSSS